jgi:hypothetical protein
MKRIVVLSSINFTPKINAQEYFPNNESVQNKTTILLLLQTLRFCKSNANN